MNQGNNFKDKSSINKDVFDKAECYLQGIGVEKDEVKAIQLLEEIADINGFFRNYEYTVRLRDLNSLSSFKGVDGDLQAQRRLGFIYLDNKNYKEAIKWFDIASFYINKSDVLGRGASKIRAMTELGISYYFNGDRLSAIECFEASRESWYSCLWLAYINFLELKGFADESEWVGTCEGVRGRESELFEWLILPVSMYFPYSPTSSLISLIVRIYKELKIKKYLKESLVKFNIKSDFDCFDRLVSGYSFSGGILYFLEVYDDIYSGVLYKNLNLIINAMNHNNEIKEKDFLLEVSNSKLKEKEEELEEMMSMFAHKFRSPLDTIIYNTNHQHQPKLYIQAAQTMRGLLDIFSIISADDIVLIEKLKRDNQGESGLLTVFGKTLDMILLHLLSAQAAEKIQQHYLHYAKKQGLCDAELSYKQWNDDYFELERQLQTEWEQSFAELLSQQATLEQRLAWLEERFFKLELQGFEQANIQFKEYGITESFLTILLNEILVNAFKYYSSDTQQSVVLVWAEGDSYQVLSCRNPSVRNERNRFKGSGKGHTFLSALARKTGSQFTKPKPQDDFVLEFGIANQLLISS